MKSALIDQYCDSPQMPSFPAGNDLAEAGLFYFNARWYDPQLGRFITEDPIKDGTNWFAYVSNNPLRYVDPTGLYQVRGQNIDGKMYYSIHTMNRADRVVNTATNVVAGITPFIGPGSAQRTRVGLDKFLGWTGSNRYSVYADTDVPGLDGAGEGIDVGQKISGTLSGIGQSAVKFLDIFGLVEQGKDDVKGLFEDVRIDAFTKNLSRGMFHDVANPEEAVERAEMFAAGANAFFEHDLEEQDISFKQWQNALVDVTNGVENELFNDTMSSLDLLETEE